MGSQWRLGSLRLCSNSGPTSRLSKNSMRTWSMPLELWSRRLPALSTNELPLLLGMSDRPAGDGLLALMASANWRISRVRKSTRWGWSWIILLWPWRPWLDFWLASAGCRAKHPNYFDSALLDSSQWVSAGIGEWRGLLCFLALCWDNVEKYCHLYFCWCLQPWQGQSATAWVVHGIWPWQVQGDQTWWWDGDWLQPREGGCLSPQRFWWPDHDWKQGHHTLGSGECPCPGFWPSCGLLP